MSKYMVLGVSFSWGSRKGIDVMIELARRLEPDCYTVVLVGTDDATDRMLPPGVVSIHRTTDQTELAALYTAADVYVNPTREDNYPTVNMEAIACGTPVLTFATGGSPEMIGEETGVVVPCDDIDALEAAVRQICEGRLFDRAACAEAAKRFDKRLLFREYIALYHERTDSRSALQKKDASE